MAKSIMTFILTLSALTVSAQPDKDWWACHYVKVAVLAWLNETWEVREFEPRPPFVLMSDGNGGITNESAGKALGSPSDLLTCEVSDGGLLVSCHGIVGEMMFFHQGSGRGGISGLFGAAMGSGPARANPIVAAFECAEG